MPYKRPMPKEGYFKKYEYVYDEYCDYYIYPNNQVLTYSTTNRDGYREYKSNAALSEQCPHQLVCHKAEIVKAVTRHVLADYMEEAEDIRHTKI